MSVRNPILGALLLLLMSSAPVRAQEPGALPAKADTTQNSALRAFLDCDERGCDRDFLVTEMTWVNWMRDRLDADFHILVTAQETGSGGQRYAVVAIGQRSFAGRTDTLEFTANPNDASDLVRRQLLRVIGQLMLPRGCGQRAGTRRAQRLSRAITASVYWSVVAVPPTSPVTTLRSSSVDSIAARIRLARGTSPTWSSS